MSFLEILSNFWNKYKVAIIASAVALIALILLMISVSNYMNLNRKYKNNIKALTDTVEVYKGKNGQLIAERSILEGNMKDLKMANEELYERIEDLEIHKPQQIVYIETEVINEVHDTTYVIDPKLDYQKKEFDFSNQFRTLNGFMELSNNELGLSILNDKVFVDYTVAFKDNKVYITSSNPYIQYNDVQGFTMPQQKRKAFSLGIGPSLTAGYDLVNKQFGVMVGASVNLSYNLIQF